MSMGVFTNFFKLSPAPSPALASDAKSYIEAVVSQVDEVPFGKTKQVTVGESTVLLCRNNKGEFSAVSSKCPHYAAPLKSGAYFNDTIRCPWHGSCFNTKTGDIEDYPTMYSLPCYQVSVRGSDVIVTIPVELNGVSRVTPSLETKSPDYHDPRTFVIIGSGAAGASCAQSLRRYKFDGRIIVVSTEATLPYDRPKLSKVIRAEAENIYLYPPSTWEKLQVEFHLKTMVTKLDSSSKCMYLDNGQTIKYDACLIASGATAMTLPIPEFRDATNVHTLRRIEDNAVITKDVKGKHVVVIGSSFTGMEVASLLVGESASLVVVSKSKFPFEPIFPSEIGKAIQALFESKGVKFVLDATIISVDTEVRECTDNNDPVTVNDGSNKESPADHPISSFVKSLTLSNGEQFPCGLVVVAIGVVPSTGFITSFPLAHPDRSIICDKHMKVLSPNTLDLYAAGDVARFNYPALGLDHLPIRIEHFGIAQYHGDVAASNMLGIPKVYNSVPYFWTSFFGRSLRFCGYLGDGEDELIFDKKENAFDPTVLSFVCFFCKQESIVGVASINRDPIVSICAQLMHTGKMPNAKTIRDSIEADGSCNQLLNNLLLK